MVVGRTTLFFLEDWSGRSKKADYVALLMRWRRGGEFRNMLKSRSVRYKTAKRLLGWLGKNLHSGYETGLKRRFERRLLFFALVLVVPGGVLISLSKPILRNQSLNKRFLRRVEKFGRASKCGVFNRFRLDLLYVVEELLLCCGEYEAAISVVRAEWTIASNAKRASLPDLIAVGHSLGLFEDVREIVCRELRMEIPTSKREYLRILFQGLGLIQEKKMLGNEVRWQKEVKDCQVFFAGPGLGTTEGFSLPLRRNAILVQIVNHRISSWVVPDYLERLDFGPRVGYINGEYSREHRWREVNLQEKGLDWIVFKSFGLPPRNGLYRFAFKPRVSFIRGSPHMAQIVVTDLLVSGASSIYITGINFHLGRVMYSDIYTDSKLKGRNNAFQGSLGLASHNPFENWGFMGLMQWAEVLEGDFEFLQILRLTPDEFAGRLAEKFGRPG